MHYGLPDIHYGRTICFETKIRLFGINFKKILLSLPLRIFGWQHCLFSNQLLSVYEIKETLFMACPVSQVPRVQLEARAVVGDWRGKIQVRDNVNFHNFFRNFARNFFFATTFGPHIFRKRKVFILTIFCYSNLEDKIICVVDLVD